MRRQTGSKPKRQPSAKIYEEGAKAGTCEQQFFQSFGRVHYLTSLGLPSHSISQLNNNLGIFSQMADPRHHIKAEAAVKDKQIADNITSHTSEEQLEYLSYLKDYSTVLKKSRINYTENADKSQEIDSLVSQFLCERGKEGKNIQAKRKEKGKRKQASTSKDSVSIRKVELEGRRKEETKSIIKDKSTHQKAQTPDRKTVNLQSAGSCVQTASKGNPKVEILGARILREGKKEKKEQISASPVPKQKGILRRSRLKTQLDTPRQWQGQRYSIGLKNDKQSYLAQNMGRYGQRGKAEKAELRSKGGEKRKPIKIAIDIPLEELRMEPGRVGEYQVESQVGLEGAEVKLVREVAERVMSLLQKSKAKLGVS